MQPKPLDTTNSPLTDEQAAQLTQLAETLTSDQLSWVSGYLAGLRGGALAPGGEQAAATPQSGAKRPTLTILYGSESGNAESLAEQAGERAAAHDIPVRVIDMADYRQRELRDEQMVLIITATHGEGDPPDPAADFHEFLHGRKAPGLKGVKFAVLALGDSSYEYFCQTGRDFDSRLEALGAERLRDRLECDVDFEEPAGQWLTPTIESFAEQVEPGENNVVAFTGQAQAKADKPRYDRRNPFNAEILDNIVLNGRGSERETRHIELSLGGSGLDYQPGDILNVLPTNREEVVGEIMETLALSPEETVSLDHGNLPLADALARDYEITTLTPAFVGAYADIADSDRLRRLAREDNRRELMQYLDGRHLIDLISEFPVKGLDARTLLGMLRRLQPREYSIASSRAANPDEVHLTVAAVRYEREGRLRHGVASTFLADRGEPGETMPVFIRNNKNFRLPDDPSTPTIMIGPGTGVAPFRAFLQEREELGATGANWLFFGNPHFRTDFLYQTEWQRWLRDGTLNRMDVAFSRDLAHKVYVQDRLREQGADVYRWLEDGAHVYVCGDADRMAPDVHEALAEVIGEHGGRSREAATEYLKTLQREKRYQRDVY